MTGQVEFDSHVWRLLECATRLVNELTPGHDGGRVVAMPTGGDLVAAVTRAVSADDYVPRPSLRAALELAALAPRVRSVFEASATGDQSAAAETVNDLIAETGPRPHLNRAEDGGYRLHFHGPDESFEKGWAAGLAAGLAIAVGSPLAGRLGVCAASDCDRVYVDTSKNSGRQFCSTRCQSRVKAAAHRARQRT